MIFLIIAIIDAKYSRGYEGVFVGAAILDVLTLLVIAGISK